MVTTESSDHMKINQATAEASGPSETNPLLRTDRTAAPAKIEPAVVIVCTAEATLNVRFIARGRDLGFSLEEIRSLLQLSGDEDLCCVDVDRLARSHYGRHPVRA